MAKMAKPGTYIKYGKTAKPIPLYTEDDVRSIFDDLVWNSIGKDATKKVADLLWDDVFQDIKECSDYPKNLNYDDVRLAFGRVLCKRLGIDSEESLEDRVEKLKGCRFNRDQIQQIRLIVNSCEQVLNLEDKNE